ncbi:MAG: DUF502 domain-containing protein [Thermaerobacterales bacterium]
MVRIRNIFLAGLIVLLPVMVSAWLLLAVFRFADGLIVQFLPALRDLAPGFGLLLTLAVVFGTGLLTTHLLGRRLIGLAEDIVGRLPLVSGIYGTVRQLVDAFTRQGSNFQRVVLIEYPRKGVWSLALVTADSQGEVQAQTQVETVNVFVPTTPNPTSGFLLMVPKSDIVPLQMSVQEGLRLIISGGVVMPETREGEAKAGSAPDKVSGSIARN